MPDPLAQVPASLAAGDSLSLRLAYADYPASGGWAATLYLRGPSVLDAAAVASGDQFVWTVPAASTAPLTPGLYQYVIRVAKGTEAATVESGALTLTANVATAAPGELQSYAEQMLAICRQARQDILSGQIKMYMIAGRQVLMHTLDDVRREENYWQARLDMQRGRGFGRAVRFDVVGMTS